MFLRRSHRTLLVLITLLIALAISGAKAASTDSNQIYRSYLPQFKVAIIDALSDLAGKLPPGERKILKEDVKLIARAALVAKRESEAGRIISLPNTEQSVAQRKILFAIYDELSAAIHNAAADLEFVPPLSIRNQTMLFVENLLAGFPVTPQSAADALSCSKLVVGGSWIHTEQSGAGGKVIGGLLVRTRLWDERPRLADGLDYFGTKTGEERFIDLIVDARFLTNSPLTVNSGDSSVDSDGLTHAILTNTRSSAVTGGLFAGLVRFSDNGVLGPVAKFQLSSLEGSSRVFRRLMLGLRMENRDRISMLRGATAETGFTKREEPSTVNNFDFGINLKRFYLTAEVPLIYGTGPAVFFSFNAEFPLGHEMQYKSLYEFRIFTILDPKALAAAISGSGESE